MEIELKSFTPAEQATFRLRALYEGAGYRKYRASRFEEYALYQEYQRFLPDSQVITFTDLDGKLRAIKPDVTLSIAKTAQPAAGECKRFYYNEEVCRPSRESHTFQTIHQMGLECMGAVDAAAQAEVVTLALQSLAALPVATVLEVSHMGFVTGLLDALQVPQTAACRDLSLTMAERGVVIVSGLAEGLDGEAADALCGLLALHGPLGATLTAARDLCRSPAQREALEELQALQNRLGEAGRGTRLDLSLADEMEYYNGLVFTGYVAGVPRAVLKGGRYDYLMQRFTPGANAIGPAWLKRLDDLLTCRISLSWAAYRMYDIKIAGQMLMDWPSLDNIFVYQPLPYVKNIYYLDVDLYRYFIGRADQSVNESIMVKRVDQQLRVTRLMMQAVDVYALPPEQQKLREYMLNYFSMMMAISSIFLALDGSKEALAKRKQLWDDLKAHDGHLYRRCRFSVAEGCNLPGWLGSKISIGGYRIAQKIFKFN